jgi:single-stranded-DNA-specific exonuclease
MSIMLKEWFVYPAAPPSLLRQYRDISPVLAQVLYNRGFTNPQSAAHFLYDRDLKAMANPFALKDMALAVGRIRQAIKRKERIAVYGDFDADGVTSTALMMQVLRAFGADALAYIPNRVDEGYGLNTPALQKLAREDGVKLVVTVDCGIRSVDDVEAGKAAGLDIVVTDHHSVGPELPRAFAVVNPQQADCGGDKTLAGCGVAFMLAWGMIMKHVEEYGADKLPRLRLSDMLDLVAIGTVADIMKLNSPLNRVLVVHGLNTINEGRRLGIRALADVAGLKLGQITAQDIGFGFGPRINAAGRLENALTAYELLSTTDEARAKELAERLQELNRRRQDLTREAQQRINAHITATGASERHLIFAQDDHVQAGIVGLVAGRLTEEYYRPTVVLERGDDESRASCRSIPEFHITHALDECADLLLRHGGHAMAAGFTVANDNLEALYYRLLDKATTALSGQTLRPKLMVDAELRLRQLTVQLTEELRLLEPTGHGNPPPLFLTRNLDVTEARTVGGDNAHLKLKLRGDNQPPIDAIGFGMGDWLGRLPARVDVVYALEVNEWQGRRNLQLRLEDLHPSEVQP